MFTLPLHLYQNYDIMGFKECVDERLIDENGWYGFVKAATIRCTNNGNELDINETINNREYGDFIDMYPGRDLFSFVAT